MLDTEGTRTLNPHRFFESKLGTEVGVNYTKDGEIKTALYKNKCLKHESWSSFDSQALC